MKRNRGFVAKIILTEIFIFSLAQYQDVVLNSRLHSFAKASSLVYFTKGLNYYELIKCAVGDIACAVGAIKTLVL